MIGCCRDSYRRLSMHANTNMFEPKQITLSGTDSGGSIVIVTAMMLVVGFGAELIDVKNNNNNNNNKKQASKQIQLRNTPSLTNFVSFPSCL